MWDALGPLGVTEVAMRLMPKCGCICGGGCRVEILQDEVRSEPFC
jgi:hypothetical protein